MRIVNDCRNFFPTLFFILTSNGHKICKKAKKKKKVLNGIIATFFKVGEIVPWYLPIWFDVHIFDFRKNKS